MKQLPRKPITPPVVSAIGQSSDASIDDKMTCERCGADMNRLHAVWRCPACRFKTDCCEW